MAKAKTKQDNEAPIVDHSACEKKNADLKAKLEVAESKYYRALADYQNLERQTQEDQSRFMKMATRLFVEQMLVPFDHLQMAAKHIQDKGLDLVIAQFRQLFESQGLREIDAWGKPFDATSMEVIDTKDLPADASPQAMQAGGEEGKVLEVVQSGYELNGVVIRHARVIVGKKA